MQSYLLAETTEAAHALPMSPAWFGITGIAFFGVLLAVTLAFRSISNKH